MLTLPNSIQRIHTHFLLFFFHTWLHKPVIWRSSGWRSLGGLDLVFMYLVTLFCLCSIYFSRPEASPYSLQRSKIAHLLFLRIFVYLNVLVDALKVISYCFFIHWFWRLLPQPIFTVTIKYLDVHYFWTHGPNVAGVGPIKAIIPAVWECDNYPSRTGSPALLALGYWYSMMKIVIIF